MENKFSIHIVDSVQKVKLNRNCSFRGTCISVNLHQNCGRKCLAEIVLMRKGDIGNIRNKTQTIAVVAVSGLEEICRTVARARCG